MPATWLRVCARGAVGALAGAVVGAAASRFAFEGQPQALAALGEWPAVLAAAGLCASVGAALAARSPRRWPALIPLLLPALWLTASETDVLRSAVLLAGALALSLSLAVVPDETPPAGRPRRHAWAAAALLAASLLALYARTLAPGVGEADAFEFQVGAARLGLAHGNGYPLLILIGRLFASLPLGGSFAWRVNVSAAAAAALATAGVFACARRLGVSPRPAWLAGLAFGTAPGLWARATEIEAYALNAALMMAVLWLGLGLLEQAEAARAKPAEGQPPSIVGGRGLAVLAFLFGLSFGNHLTTAMLLPALALAAGSWLWAAARRGRSAALRPAAAAGLALLLGLAIFAYIPLRWPAVGGGQPFTLERMVFFLRGGEAAAQFDPLLPFAQPQRLGYAARKLLAEFTPMGAALAAAGLVALAGSASALRRRQALFLGLALAGHVYFVLAYNPPEPDYSDFFVAPYGLMAIALAVGLQAGLSALTGRLRAPALAGAARAAGLSAFALIPLASIWVNLPRLDLSAGSAREAVGRFTLGQPLQPGAALLADPKRYAAPYFLQAAEGLRPDLDIVLLPDEAAYRAALEERLAAGQTVYLARYLAGLGAGYSLRSIGPLAEVAARPFLQPPVVPHTRPARLAGGVELLGFGLDSPVPDTRWLTLFWRAPAAPAENLAVYLRLRSGDGAVAWQSAGAVPVDGLYPTNAWRGGEYVSDFHALSLPASLPAGAYGLQVGLFPPFAPAKDGWVDLTTLDLAPARPPAPARALRARFGSGPQAVWLLGYDAPEAVLPGQPTAVTLYWLRGAAATATAFGQTRSLAAWPAGAVAAVRYELPAPAGQALWQLSVEDGSPARCGWLAPESGGCPLAPIAVNGTALPAGARNFAGLLVLRRAALETAEAAPGEGVHVTLEWQGLRAMDQSYTVFVHLVGPDGRLYGQKDYWPVEGTRLTSSWSPGEVIRDPYLVPLAADAPPGAYSVHIGLYLLDTLERLPVLNDDGQPVDDKVVLAGLTVR